MTIRLILAKICQTCLPTRRASFKLLPSPVTRHPSPVTRHPSPVTRNVAQTVAWVERPSRNPGIGTSPNPESATTRPSRIPLPTLALLTLFAFPHITTADTTAVGSTPGSFAVGPSGAASYSIPINVPPGINGIQPNLALSYNSQGGNGLMGVGWGLSGLSAITRCPATQATDGVRGSVNYDVNEKFCLDGQRLILTSGSYGGNPSTYRTEIDTFAQISASGTAGNGPASFTVKTKGGQILEFGNDASGNSRIEAQGKSTVAVWALNKVSDRANNSLKVTYTENNGNGEFYPAKMEYTENSTTGTSPFSSVTFDYDFTRPDIEQRYQAGSVMKTTARLTHVKTLVGTTSVRDYRIGYDTSAATGRSRVNSVQECAYDSAVAGWACLGATAFAQSPGNSGTVNAFGIPSGSGANVIANAGGPWMADVNGDGRSDVVWLYDNGAGKYLTYSLSTGTGFGTPTGTGANVIANAGGPWMADVNGDGKSDVVWLYDNGAGKYLTYALSTGAGFGTPTGTGANVIANGGGPWIADVDGDGRSDVVWLYDNGAGKYLTYALSTGAGFGTPTGTGANVIANGGGPWIADVNGDGKSDVVWLYDNGAGKYLTYALSTGAGFGTPTGTGANVIANGGGPWIADVNGDGKSDVVWLYDNGSGKYLSYALSTGTGYGTPTGTGANVIANAGGPWIADMSGTGKSDAVWLYGNGGSNFLSYSLASGGIPDLLTTITPAYGPTTTLTYKPLTDTTVYTKDNTAVSPYTVSDYQGPMYVVSQVKTSNAVGGNFTTDYTYGGAKIDHDGRGFLGFRWTQAKDGSGLYTKTYYSQTFPTTGMPTTVEQWRPGSGSDRMVKSVVNTVTYKKTLGSANTYFPYVSSSTETTYDLATGWWGETYGMQAITTLGYDDYGNPGPAGSPIVVTTSDGYTKSTTNTYNPPDTVNWFVGQLSKTQVTNSGPGLLQLTRTSGFGYDPITGFLKQEKIEPGNTAFEVTTDYGYDSYGRRTTATVSGAGTCTAAKVGACVNTGIVSRTTTTKYDINSRLNGNASTLLIWANKVTNALDQTETQEFDPKTGAITKLTGPNALATSWTYDAFGRKLTESRADGTNSTWTYVDADANKPTNAVRMIATTGTGEPNAAVYLDSLSREVRKRVQGFDGTHVFVDTSYDSYGRVSAVTRPYYQGAPFYPSYMWYDILGRITQHTAANGAITQTTYSNNTVTVTDANNHATKQTRNGLGQLVSVTDAKNGTVTYKYDAFGNLEKTTDPANNVVEMKYNQRGQKTKLIDKDMGTWDYIYNVLGQLLTQTDNKNQVSTMTYDKLGRLTQRVETGVPSNTGMTSNWYYDTAANGKGKLDYTTTSTGYRRGYTYDSIGRPRTETSTIDGVAYGITTGYDTSGRVSTVAYPIGFSITNNYNTYGYQSSVSKTGTPTTVYWTANKQNAAGQVTEELLGNFVTTKRTIDDGTGWIDAVYSGLLSGSEVQSNVFVFDGVGNLTDRSDDNAGISEIFVYDELNRLTKATGGPLSNSGVKTYDYDSIGNIKSKSDVGTYEYTNGRPHAVSRVYGTVNASYLYDENGNMYSGNGVTITYTAWNMPSSMTKGTTTTTFSYDSEHQRTIETVGTTKKSIFLSPRIDAGVHFEVETTNGKVENKHTIYARGAPVAQYTTKSDSTNETVYYHKDHLGSIVAISNSSGAAIAKYWYDAWGKRVVLSGSTDYTHHGFTGHQQLDDYGLIHMNGRIYDPVIGRFQTADPNVFYPESTQGFNRYSYVDNNPLSYTDPSGFKTIFDRAADSVRYEWNNSAVFRVVVVVAAGAVLGAGAFALLSSGAVGTVGVGALTFTKGVSLGYAMLLGGAALGVPQVVRELGGSAPDNPTPGSGATIGGGGSSGGSGGSASVGGGGSSDGAANSTAQNNAAAQRVLAEYYPGGFSGGSSNQGAGVASNSYANSMDGDESTYAVTFGGGGGPLLMTSMAMMPTLIKAGAEALAKRLAANAAAKAVATKTVQLTQQQLKSIASYERNILEHQAKIDAFRANPTIRPGMENLPKEVIEKQWQRRIDHLESEIRTFRENIGKIERGELGS